MMSTVSKDILGIASIGICLVQYIPLIYLTLIGKKRPHVLSRLVWATAFGVVALGQWIEHGGAGSWSNIISATLSIAIAVAALRRGFGYVTKGDWVFFIAALAAIPLWLLTNNPLTAVAWSTAIDVVGYIPTFRKVWRYPYDEMLFAGLMSFSKLLLGFLALENYNLITMLFPISGMIMEAVFAGIIVWRRYILKQSILP